ncbi:putative bifunctional diguanylate cyclase/phosphodiesterase [Actinoplanes sp. GCM10030250]|uniref:putative bifunctional diguanylate cyclase/phosphodiesterase n=1 Tax=Actinoplanes sp. GCM10030250 TaxID=3273376 RepID=UPI0036156CB1
MTGEPPTEWRTNRPAVLVALAILAAVTLTTGLVLLPPSAGAGLLTACSAGIAVVMLRAAASGRSGGPRLRVLTLGCGVLLTAGAGAASAVTVVVAPDVLVAEVPLPTEIPLVALFLVALTYLPAILRPLQRRDQLARLRVGLDTVGGAACLILPPWLLLQNAGPPRGAAITALIAGGAATAVVAVAGVHAIRHRAALLWCGSGAALSLIGLTALVVGIDYPFEPNAAIGAFAGAAAVNVAAGLLWYGSVRISPDAHPMAPAGSEPSASFPLLALPIGAAVLGTVYHLLNGHSLDPMSIVLATTAIVAVAAREWVSAIALRRHAEHLTDQGNRLRSLMFGAADVAMILDADLAVRWQSPAAARQFGLSDQEVLGRAASVLVDPEQADTLHTFLAARLVTGAASPGESVAVRLRDGFGRWRETEWTTSGGDPAEPGRTLVVHVRDVTEMRNLEQALRQAAHLDQQTSLANRQGLRRAAELIHDPGALIVIELSGLTAIGDVHGPDVADVVAVEAARRLRNQVDSADVPARLGETRFAVLTRCGAVRAHLLAGQLLSVLSAPYSVAGTVSRLSAWAGLTDLTAEAEVDEVIRRAGLALRSARSGPPASVEWYDEQMEARLLRRSTLEQDLPGAVSRGEFDLNYQPIAELPGQRPAGVEVLISWRHPTLGPVPAGELLAQAEELGLLHQIGHWVLQRSCRLLAEWRRQHESLWLAVPVRPRELLDPAFQVSLRTALEVNRLPPSALVIEVAEQDLSQEGEDLGPRLGELRAYGVRTAVGNFGAGPTSLSRLRVLPIDLLKIDQGEFGQFGEIMDVVVILGRRLGLEVIACGVSTPADLDAVRTAGCRLGQGDLLGRAAPAEHFEAMLERSRDASHGNS